MIRDEGQKIETELIEQIKKIIVESMKSAMEHQMNAEDFKAEIEQRIWDKFDRIYYASQLGCRKIRLGEIKKSTYDYFYSIKENEFKHDLNWNDFVETKIIFDCIHGYLILIDTDTEAGYQVEWYPVGYENFIERKYRSHWEDGEFRFLIVETEGFKTPKFLLRPDKIPGYCVAMAKNGFSLVESLEYRDFGWKYDDEEHDYDFYKLE